MINCIVCPGCGKKDVPDTLKRCPECSYVFNVPTGSPLQDQDDTAAYQTFTPVKRIKKNKLPLILGVSLGAAVLVAAVLFVLLKFNVIGAFYPNIGVSLNDLIENSDGQYELSDFTKGDGNYTFNFLGAGGGRSRIVADTASVNAPMRSITFVWDLESAVFNAIDKDEWGDFLASLISIDLDNLFGSDLDQCVSLEELKSSEFVKHLVAAQNLLKSGAEILNDTRVTFDKKDGEAYCTVSPLENGLTVSDMKKRSCFSEFPRLPTPNDYAEIIKVHSDNEYNYYTYLPSDDLDEAFKKFGDYAVYVEQKGFTIVNMETNSYPILNGNGSPIADLTLQTDGDKCLFVFSFKK